MTYSYSSYLEMSPFFSTSSFLNIHFAMYLSFFVRTILSRLYFSSSIYSLSSGYSYFGSIFGFSTLISFVWLFDFYLDLLWLCWYLFHSGRNNFSRTRVFICFEASFCTSYSLNLASNYASFGSVLFFYSKSLSSYSSSIVLFGFYTFSGLSMA